MIKATVTENRIFKKRLTEARVLKAQMIETRQKHKTKNQRRLQFEEIKVLYPEYETGQ